MRNLSQLLQYNHNHIIPHIFYGMTIIVPADITLNARIVHREKQAKHVPDKPFNLTYTVVFQSQQVQSMEMAVHHPVVV